jgi:SsrA-binding protein
VLSNPLLHKRQINKPMGAADRKAMTLVPLERSIQREGRAKVEFALAKGKKLHDKRETGKKGDCCGRRAETAQPVPRNR